MKNLRMLLKQTAGIAAAILPAVLLFSFLSLPVQASGSAQGGKDVVKVGIIPYPGYAENKNGIWTGYDAEMMENIAQNAGFRVSFVPENSLKQIQDDLSAGRIDIAGNLVKTKERENRFLYSEYEQGSSSLCIDVRKDNDTIEYGNVEQIAGLSFAAMDSETLSEFRSWCREHEISPEITLYETIDEMFAAVDTGRADATVIPDDTSFGGKYRTVLSFKNVPYYYVFTKDNTELKSQVDAAAARIIRQDPLYENALRDKYGINAALSMDYSRKEKSFILTHPDISVAVVENDEPYYRTGPDGEATGILPDFYAEIARNTGFHFTFSVYPTQKEAASSVLSGKTDVLGMYSDGIPYAYNDGFRLTSAYSSVALVMITRAGTDAGSIRTVAVKKRSSEAVSSLLSKQLKDTEFVQYGTAAECFDALKKHRTDALIVALPSATWLINQVSSTAYSFVPLSSSGLDLSAAVTYDNRTLADILSIGIVQSSGLFDGIVSNNTGADDTLQTAVSRIPAAAILIIAATMMAIVFLLIWAVVMLVRSRHTKIAAVRSEAAAEESRLKAEAIVKSAEEKNAFFSNISHDMRTPLNGILGFADLAEKQDSLPAAKEYIEKIRSSGNLLLGLINDTLSISKFSSGKMELQPKPVSTDAITSAICDSIRAAAVRKGVDFMLDDTGLRSRVILADRLSLEKIFLNLLSNAVKFTPKGGHVRLTVCDDPKDSPDPDIVIRVSDDGIGMSEEFMRHMYEPFSQEKRHGYDSVGTGLGLSIVKQLVDLMGGTISAESASNKGTVFTVRLHFKETEAPETADDKKTPQPASLAGRKILLCEDNALNREIAVALLQEEGMSVVNAENGKEGLTCFSESRPGA